jgi:hypothetical protein
MREVQADAAMIVLGLETRTDGASAQATSMAKNGADSNSDDYLANSLEKDCGLAHITS